LVLCSVSGRFYVTLLKFIQTFAEQNSVHVQLRTAESKSNMNVRNIKSQRCIFDFEHWDDQSRCPNCNNFLYFSFSYCSANWIFCTVFLHILNVKTPWTSHKVFCKISKKPISCVAFLLWKESTKDSSLLIWPNCAKFDNRRSIT